MFPSPNIAPIGDKLCIYDETLTKASTQVVIDGLDMLRDGDYYLVCQLQESSGGGVVTNCYINGLSTTYISQRFYSQGTTVAAAGLSIPTVGMCNNLFLSGSNTHLSMANGLVSALVANVDIETTAIHYFYAWRKVEVVANVTSLLLQASNPLAIGSNFKLYKRSI
jgi:hypothetical protein